MRTAWTEEEKAIVREHYPVIGGKVSAMLPGRSRDAIRGCARKLKLSAPNVSRPWTAKEDAVLNRSYKRYGAAIIVDQLPGRSVIEIHNRARTLGLQVERLNEKSKAAKAERKISEDIRRYA